MSPRYRVVGAVVNRVYPRFSPQRTQRGTEEGERNGEGRRGLSESGFWDLGGLAGLGREGVSIEWCILEACAGMVGGTPPQVPFGRLRAGSRRSLLGTTVVSMVHIGDVDLRQA